MDFIWEYLGSINSGILGGLLAAPIITIIAISCKLDRPGLHKLKEKLKRRGWGNWETKFATLWTVSFFGLFFSLMFGLIGVHEWIIDRLLNKDTLTFLWVAHVATVFPMFGISLYFSMTLCRKWGLKRGGMQYRRYAAFKALKYTIDPIKMQKRLLRPIQILSIFGLALASMVHATIDGTKLSYLPYFSFEKINYNLSDATKVIIYSKSIAPNGNVINNSTIVIKFSNGDTFNSQDTQLYFATPRKLKLAKLVEKYSDIKIIMSNSVNYE